MPELARRKHKRPRPQTSCAICHRRKVKCNKQLPCGPCVRHGCPAECRYDGIPAQSIDDDLLSLSRHADELDEESSIGFGLAIYAPGTEPRSRSPSARTRAVSKLKNSHRLNGNEPDSNLHLSPQTGLPTHDWVKTRSACGRTHLSWSLQKFEPLMVYVDQASFIGDGGAAGLFSRQRHELQRMKDLDTTDMAVPTTIYDELPPVRIICDLMLQYYDTFDTVYSLIDHSSFGRQYNAMLADPSSVKVSFVVKALLIMALANATYPPKDAPVPRSTTLRWLDLATSNANTVIELNELDTDAIRMLALLNLANQVLKFNATADYIHAGSCVRAAMTLDMHQNISNALTPDSDRSSDQGLWEAIQDLDLSASLASGLPPTMVPTAESEPESDLDMEDIMVDPAIETANGSDKSGDHLRHVLSRSLSVRRRIVNTLNTTQQLPFDDVLRLTRSLDRSMAPISSTASAPSDAQTFKYHYFNFVHMRYLLALHRPFAMTHDPAFHLSRSLVIRSSTNFLTNLCATFYREAEQLPPHSFQTSSPDPFSPLLTGHGTPFRLEAQQSVLQLSYELYRRATNSDDNGVDVPSFASVRALLEEVLPIAEQKVRTHELAGETLVIPTMVLAHVDAACRFAKDSAAYTAFMQRAGNDVVGRFLGAFVEGVER